MHERIPKDKSWKSTFLVDLLHPIEREWEPFLHAASGSDISYLILCTFHIAANGHLSILEIKIFDIRWFHGNFLKNSVWMMAKVREIIWFKDLFLFFTELTKQTQVSFELG